MTDRLDRFSQHYRGRHLPEDALWWLTHPDRCGPSGARPVQEVFLEAADELRDVGMAAAADAMLNVLADLLQADRDAALDALAHATCR